MFGTVLRVLAAVLLVGLLGGIGVSIYQAGFVAGAAADGSTVVAPIGAYGWYGPGWGFGHLLFGFFGLLVVLFLVGGLLRAIFWRGPRSWGGGSWGQGRGPWGPGSHGFRGEWESRAREIHDEWHRRGDGGGGDPIGGPPGSGSPSGTSAG